MKAGLVAALLLAAVQAWAAAAPSGLYASEADVLLFEEGRVTRAPTGAPGGVPAGRSGRFAVDGGTLVVTWADGRREAGRYGAAEAG